MTVSMAISLGAPKVAISALTDPSWSTLTPSWLDFHFWPLMVRLTLRHYFVTLFIPHGTWKTSLISVDTQASLMALWRHPSCLWILRDSLMALAGHPSCLFILRLPLEHPSSLGNSYPSGFTLMPSWLAFYLLPLMFRLQLRHFTYICHPSWH